MSATWATTGFSGCNVSDPVNVFHQVGDLYAELLRGYAPLNAFTVISELSVDVATGDEDGDAIRIDFVGSVPNVAFGQGETNHVALYDFTVTTRSNESGTLTRDGINAIAHIVAALAADRTLGGLIEDTQEVDLASTEANGVDVNGTSLRIRSEFTTSRDDWFQLVTA